MFKKGHSGFAGRKHSNKPLGVPGSTHTLRALSKLRREPVAELIKVADATESTDLKISLWKYLLERRDAGIELLGPSVGDIKADLEALEAPSTKPLTPPAS